MSVKRARLGLCLLFLATALGLHSLGVFDDPGGFRGIETTGTGGDLGKMPERSPRSSAEPLRGSSATSVTPPGAPRDRAEASGGGAGALERFTGTAIPEAPRAMRAPDVPAGDVEISPDAGLAVLKRARPASALSSPTAAAELPAGLHPDDVEISRETGLATLKSLRPGEADSRSPAAAGLPVDMHADDVEISPETGLATLKRLRAEGSDSHVPAVAELPPDVHSDTVEISPQTGLATLKQLRPETPGSQPRPIAGRPPKGPPN